MLHLVVYHRNHPTPPWRNDWLDDDRVKTIPTTPAVGRLCEAAKRRGERVRFHRCGYGTFRPLVCAEAQVASVQFVDRELCLVHFEEHTVLHETPPVSPPQGTKWYPA
jgi:hypothetical protein